MMGVAPPCTRSRARIAAVASLAASFRASVSSMSTRSKVEASSAASASLSVHRERHRVSGRLQHPNGDPLIDDIVFGQEDVQGWSVKRPRWGRRNDVPGRRASEGREDGLAERGLPDRLDEILGDSKLTAARCVAGFADDVNITIAGLSPPLVFVQSFRDREPSSRAW